MTTIVDISAYEVLDSRGFPTVCSKVSLADGTCAHSMVPSGASTGSQEALELRDDDKLRYMGKGTLSAVANINQDIAVNLIGLDVREQRKLDMLMCQVDGTDNKQKLGANAILAVSMAIAKAAAASQGQELYQYLASLHGNNNYVMPMPMMNILNGGAHADNNIDIQEFMIIPVGAKTFSDRVRWGVEIYYHLKQILKDKQFNTAVGDEGGFAPNLDSDQQTLALLSQAIEQAGFKLGDEVALALDCAASELYTGSKYLLNGENKQFSSKEFIDYLSELRANHPIHSIEDCLDENDPAWSYATTELGKNTQLVGDDLFVTNSSILQQGINNKLANAILIKPNQVGTITQTLECIKLAQDNNYKVVISHRSGETEDSFIADLAVATAAGQIKTGAVCRSDRVAKYNRLLMIEQQLNA